MSKGATGEALGTGKGLINKYQGVQDQLGQQLQQILNTGDKGGGTSILPSVIGGYTDIASTGGYDPSIVGRMRSGYSEFADTGGVSPESESAIADMASRAARSSYETAGSEASRARSITGGYGYNPAIEASLARKGSNAASEAARSTTATLVPMKQQGRLAGLSGLGGTEEAITRNRLAAMGGGASLGTDLIRSILANYANTGSITSGLFGQQAGLAKQPGFGSNLLSGFEALFPKGLQVGG